MGNITGKKIVSLHFLYNGKDHSIVFKDKMLFRIGALFEEFLILKCRKKLYKRNLEKIDKNSNIYNILKRKYKRAAEQEKRALYQVNDLVKKETIFFYTVSSLEAIIRSFHGYYI